MTFDIDKIFLPSTGVDMVFNINSLTPYSRSSIIYDIDLKKNEILIAQPLIPFSKNTQFRELHLTTVIYDKNIKRRVGIECVQFRIIDKYKLVNKTDVSATVLKYNLPIKETNIRSAFRLYLGTKYAIKGKIIYNNKEYMTSRYFSIRDISISGVGLNIPKKNNKTNPLSRIKIHEKILIGIVLINMDQNKPVATLPVKVQVIRIEPDYSDTQSLMGVKILQLKTDDETILNKFIHDAQVDELKRLSKRIL